MAYLNLKKAGVPRAAMGTHERTPLAALFTKGTTASPSCTRFKCTRTCCYYCLMFVLTSKHKQRLRKGVTSTKQSTYIRSTYNRECQRHLVGEPNARWRAAPRRGSINSDDVNNP